MNNSFCILFFKGMEFYDLDRKHVKLEFAKNVIFFSSIIIMPLPHITEWSIDPASIIHITFRAHSFTTLLTDLYQKITVLHLSGALMEYLLEESAQLRLW